MKTWLSRAVLLPLILSVPALFGQGTGSITGTVRDNTGAVIPKADVALTDTATRNTLRTTTNNEGEFLFAAVPPGGYDLAVTAVGFNKFESKGIILRVSQRARVDANLAVGDVKTAVTVEGVGVTQVETESSEVSGVVTGKEISQIVLNGRNFTQLVTLTPGVSNQTGQDEGTVGVYGNVNYSINGGRNVYNNWEIDGGDNMDNGSNSTLNVYPNVDAIAEVRVLTSDYGAQYGRNGSGTIETVTKSGTKDFHGNLSEFVRNDAFNARNFFDGDAVPSYKKNDFGYTVGGPVWIPGLYNTKKDKTFFFWSQEWRKERLPSTYNLQVPSNQQRQGNFADVCPSPGSSVNKDGFPDCPVNPLTNAYYPNNTVPIDPNAQAIMGMVPAPTYGSGAESFFNSSVTSPTNWREELVRIDQNFNDTTRFFFRYIHDSWNTVTPTSLWSGDSFPTVGTNFVGPGVSLVAHLTKNVSPTLLNEFTFSYTADHIFLQPSGTWQRPSSMTMTGLFNNGFGGKLPGMSINNGAPYGGGFTADAAGYPWVNANPTYTFRDQIAKIWGSHNIYAGFYMAAQQKNENNGAETQGFLNFDNSSPVSTGNAWADFLAGRIANFSQNNAQTKYYYRSKIFEPYLQDDWHVSRKLTLNLGLRMSVYGSYYEKFKQFYNFSPAKYDPSQAPQIDTTGDITGNQGSLIPGSGNPYTGLFACGTSDSPCYKNHPVNWAPRFGFAYDPFGNGKWAIRGGYGIFWEHLNGNEAISGLEGTPPLILNPSQYNIVGYTNIGGGGVIGTTGTTAYSDQMRWPYMQQWHIDIQHDLFRNTVGTVSYVGSKGTHLVWQRDINQLLPVQPNENPFQPGQPLTSSVCDTVSGAWTPGVSGVVNGQTVTGHIAQNLAVACGKNPADPYRRFQGYSSVTLIEPQANSIYNSMQVAVRRSAGRNLFTLAYTWSHSLDNSSDRYDTNFLDSYNMSRTRASSNFDQRHILNIGYVLEAPFLRNTKTLAGKILGGWQLSGLTTFQTGTPFSITTNNGNGILPGAGVGNGAGAGAYADVIGNPNATPPITDAPDIKGPLLFNPAAFAAPTGLTFGNAGRNIMRNPSRLNFDVGMFKQFYVTESANFEFRAEGFNIFNHTQFNGVNNSISCYGGANNSAGDATCLDQSFLHPSGAHNPRILQFGLKFNF